MENLVPCKICQKEFDYSPGSAGNAKQICVECRLAEDQKEFEAMMEETIVENNKYLVGAPGRKDAYDPSDIILNGNIPTFENDLQRFLCAVEVGRFIKRNGFCEKMENINAFLDSLTATHRVVCEREWSLEIMEVYAKHPINIKRTSEMINKISGGC